MKRLAGLLVLSTLLTLLPLTAASSEEAIVAVDTKPPAHFEWIQTPMLPHGGGDGLLEGEAASDGTFRLSFRPDLSVAKFYFQFDLSIAGKVHRTPFSISLDFDGWKPPPREDTTAWQYSKRVLKHYSAFIRSINYGERYEPLFVRYGKLMGVTLGHGALLNGFFDLSVDLRAGRPGLEVIFDHVVDTKVKAGFHFLTTDIYDPSLVAWRAFARPLRALGKMEQFYNFEIGLSYAASTLKGEADKQLMALDLSYPILQTSLLSINLFSDLIAQTSDGLFFYPALAWRYGLSGLTRKFINFNFSITHPINEPYYMNYLSSNFETRSEEESQQLLLPLGTYRLEAKYGLTIVQQQLYLGIKMASLCTARTYHDYEFQASLHLDKRLFNIVSLDFTYEKLYPTATGERFLEGVLSLKNVEFKTAAIVKLKPYTIDLSLHASFDERAAARYRLSTAVRITIL